MRDPQTLRSHTSLALAISAILCLLPSISASAQTHAALATTDTRIELIAAPNAPALTSLSGASKFLFQNQPSENLPTSIEVDGEAIPITWQFIPSLSSSDTRQVEFLYESAKPHLRLRWRWAARAAFGPLEHTVTIENLDTRELWLPLIDSLALSSPITQNTNPTHFYVEKGADKPSAAGTHLAPIVDGYAWTGQSSTYAHPAEGQPREIIPIEIVFDAHTSAGWYAGIEFSGRTRISLARNNDQLETRLGLNSDPDPGPAFTRLPPGGSFTTPTVFLGAFTNGLDGAGNQLRPWVRAVLNSPTTWDDPQYPLTVNNSWGSGMQVDEPLALRMIADSKELGLEMFHIDAGWFRGVGDWYPNPAKFPHGLAPIADEAHRQGLRIGLWVDWTQAALDTTPGALNVNDPKTRDWLVADTAHDWKPEDFKGQTIDIGLPAAHAYAAREVERIVHDYHLDMLEHDGYVVAQGCTRDDHPHAPPNRSTLKVTHDSGADFALGSNSTDVSYHAVRAYYDIQEQLRRDHPGLLLEICNDGGRMIDFGSAAHGDYFSITDAYDPLSNRQAFYDASHVLPAAMLEDYVEKWPTPTLANFHYMLRSGMMGWLTIMLDTSQWTPEQRAAARAAFALYKQQLRPLIRDAQLFHVSPRPDGIHWDGIQYWNPATKKGVLYAFRGTGPDEPVHSFPLAGLAPGKHYRLHFEDNSSPDTLRTGAQLMHGLSVHRSEPQSSELIFLEEIAIWKKS